MRPPGTVRPAASLRAGVVPSVGAVGGEADRATTPVVLTIRWLARPAPHLPSR